MIYWKAKVEVVGVMGRGRWTKTIYTFVCRTAPTSPFVSVLVTKCWRYEGTTRPCFTFWLMAGSLVRHVCNVDLGIISVNLLNSLRVAVVKTLNQRWQPSHWYCWDTHLRIDLSIFDKTYREIHARRSEAWSPSVRIIIFAMVLA